MTESRKAIKAKVGLLELVKQLDSAPHPHRRASLEACLVPCASLSLRKCWAGLSFLDVSLACCKGACSLTGVKENNGQ